MKIKIVITILLLASGCSYSWTRQNFNQAEFQRDEYECERDADMRVAGYGRIGMVERGYYLASFKRDCFHSKGYYQTKD
jgi:hypothetical protein